MADRPRNDAADLEEFLATHPEHAAELDRRFPAERPEPDFKVTFDRPVTPKELRISYSPPAPKLGEIEAQTPIEGE